MQKTNCLIKTFKEVQKWVDDFLASQDETFFSSRLYWNFEFRYL